MGARSGRSRVQVGAVLAVAALLALGAAGCSSDDAADDGPTTTADPAAAGGEASTGERAVGTYLALGDSYTQGYQPEGGDLRKGFPNLVPALAEARGYDLELVNLGCGGATVGSLADGDGCAEPARAPDGEVYEGSQLEAAEAYLEDHPGEVEVVSLSIGGNDVTTCATQPEPIPCVIDGVGKIDAGLGDILGRLREAAGPDTVIIGTTYPDVILGSWVLGTEDLAGLSVTAFKDFINPMYAKAYEAVDGIFVDVTEATGAYTPLTETTTLEPYGEIPVAVAQVCELTWFCENQDIHPRDAGHERIAELLVAALPERG